jgi:hypothetical protein
MELWERPGARVDRLVLHASRAEVEAADIDHALSALDKLLKPEVAQRLKGRLIFEIRGYEDDPRDLWEIPEVRAWMKALDQAFPYWFYFMDVGPGSTLAKSSAFRPTHCADLASVEFRVNKAKLTRRNKAAG